MAATDVDITPPPPPQHIRRISRMLAWTCLGLIVVLPCAVIGYWMAADAAQLALRAQLPAQAIHGPLQTWQRAAGALITLAPLSLWLIGLWQARKCFRLFVAGEVFSAQTVRCLKRFAGWAAASVALGMVAATAISVVVTLNNPPGLRHLAIGIGSDQIFALFFAGMVWLMAAVIGQGRALAEENATFV